MGLDISHDAWRGAYSAFALWRETLAQVADLPPLSLMEGFYSPDNYRNPFYCFGCHKLSDGYAVESIIKSLPIKWDSLKPDVLFVLLDHSDCDGEIEVQFLKPLADRLEELLPALEEIDKDWKGSGHIERNGGFAGTTRKFINGARAAALAGEPLGFH